MSVSVRIDRREVVVSTLSQWHRGVGQLCLLRVGVDWSIRGWRHWTGLYFVFLGFGIAIDIQLPIELEFELLRKEEFEDRPMAPLPHQTDEAERAADEALAGAYLTDAERDQPTPTRLHHSKEE